MVASVGVSMSLDSTGVPGRRKGRQNGLKVVLDVGRRLQLVSAWVCPHPYPFLLTLTVFFFCFHLAFLIKLHAKKHCIPMPVLCSLNSKPTFITVLCPSLTSPERHRSDLLTLMWMSPNEDIHKYGHIRAHHLAVPLGRLHSPQISGHGDRRGQPIIPPISCSGTHGHGWPQQHREWPVAEAKGLSGVLFGKAKQPAEPTSCCPSAHHSQGWQHRHARQPLSPEGPQSRSCTPAALQGR